MAPVYFEEELLMLLTGLLSGLPSAVFGIATYVLGAAAIYGISRRRGLRKPWLAWVPVVNVWLLGSLSDQYQYVVRRENKSKRKWLLALSILNAVLTAVISVYVVVIVTRSIMHTGFYGYHSRNTMMTDLIGPVMTLLGLALPLAGCTIARCVIRYMALYDVFRSLDPGNSVLYLVLSVLFHVTEPFFLFFNRNKDDGMPPRKQEPVYQETYQQPAQEPWEQEAKNYL